MPNPKTYKALSEIPGAKIFTCSQILPNRLQCWRSGDFLVTETVPQEPTEKDPSTSKEVTYQLCAAHAKIQQSADEHAAKAESEGDAVAAEKASNLNAAAPPTSSGGNVVQTPTGAQSSPEPGSFHEQMLKTLQGEQTTTMPKGEDSPNNQ